jgi:hypothetical protein
MATVTPKPLVQGTLLTNSLTTYYTVPGATTATIRAITLCNNDSVARTVTMHLVASGSSADAANQILKAVPLDPGETLIDDSVRAMNTGDFIRAMASQTNVVALRVDGAEITA